MTEEIKKIFSRGLSYEDYIVFKANQKDQVELLKKIAYNTLSVDKKLDKVIDMLKKDRQT